MSVSQAKRNISSHESSRQIQTHQKDVFAKAKQTNHQLIDRGTNGGLAGADMRVLHTTPREINIVGIDDHEFVENSNTRLLLISCSQGILSSSSFSCYLLLRLLVYMYLSQLMRTFTNYLRCIVISF